MMANEVWENERSREMMERIHAYMDTPPPRPARSEFRKAVSSPISAFLAFMGFFMIGLCVFLFLLLWNSFVNAGRNPLGLIVILAAGLSLIAWALYMRELISKSLISGALFKGEVLHVRPMPVYINGRWFFRVDVRFDGPNGETIIGKDSVDSWSVEYFLQKRDEKRKVDIIYRPNALRRVVLPMKVAIGKRYD